MVQGTFVTAVNCMDGRVQEPVLDWLKEQYQADYVDMVTEAGPNKVLLEGDHEAVQALKSKIEVSLNAHGSRVIAIAGHYDCAGNPVDKREKWEQTRRSVSHLQDWYPDAEVIGLWVNENWQVESVE